MDGLSKELATSPGKRRNRSTLMLPDPGVQQWTVPGNTSPQFDEIRSKESDSALACLSHTTAAGMIVTFQVSRDDTYIYLLILRIGL